MSEAIPPLPNTPSWRGDKFKKLRDFTFTFILTFSKNKAFTAVLTKAYHWNIIRFHSHFQLGLPNGPFPSGFQIILYEFYHLPHACYMAGSSPTPLFTHPNSIG
jgi:hypothetical protein